jgi:hypothetical protein
MHFQEGLHTATYLLNRLRTKAISTTSPYFTLHGVATSYEHLRVFGCACYPNLFAKAAHKLAPRSTRCIFLRYSADHKGYRCLDLTTNNIVIFRHVVFDEVYFFFSASPRLTNDLDILLQDDSPGAASMPAPLSAPPCSIGLSTAGRCWQSNHELRRSARPRNRGWRSDREPRRSDRPQNRG